MCDPLTCSSLPNNCVADPQSLAVLNLPMLRQDRAGMGITVCTEHTAPPSNSQQSPMGSTNEVIISRPIIPTFSYTKETHPHSV